jgi:hypothetical protein
VLSIINSFLMLGSKSIVWISQFIHSLIGYFQFWSIANRAAIQTFIYKPLYECMFLLLLSKYPRVE